MRCGRLQRSRRAGIQIGIHTNHAALVPDSGCISRGIWPERRVGRRCRAAPNAPAGAGAAWHSGASRPVDRDSCQFGDAHHLVPAGDPVGHRPAFCAHRVALRRPGRMGIEPYGASLSVAASWRIPDGESSPSLSQACTPGHCENAPRYRTARAGCYRRLHFRFYRSGRPGVQWVLLSTWSAEGRNRRNPRGQRNHAACAQDRSLR
ncbi:hypothetical protein KRIGEM_03124 (plasmid) [Komagataeibacter rhaeticus]|nr:hypothetical protein KRIGEM_03124 [Komagataeibacter rhaeticus]